jgi:hypothetical protein
MNLIHRAAVAIVVISSLQVALTGGAHPEGGPDGEFSNVRLTGIVIEPDRRLAIFAVTGAETRILSVGEALNGWKLDSISPGEVSLSGPGGTRTLQPQGDTTLVRQAPLPAVPVQPPPAAPPGQPQADAPSGRAPGPPQTAVSPAPARVGAPEPVRRRPRPPVTAPVPSAPMRPQ